MKLCSVMTKRVSDEIMAAAQLCHEIRGCLANINGLIAAEAKCHLSCMIEFHRSTKKIKEESKNCDLAIFWHIS